MKKEKVLALLLTAAMSVTAAAPVAAADFTDDTAVVFDAEETQTVEADGENSFAEASQETEAAGDEISVADETDEADVEIADAETEPEILTDDASEDYEDGEISVQAAEDEEDVFSDGVNAENAVEVQALTIRGTVPAEKGSISDTIPAGAEYRYKVTLPTGGNLSLKGNSSDKLQCFIMDERENTIGEVYSFNKAYELAQGNYIILIRNNSKEYEGTFSLRTYFDTQGATTFPENSNDRIDTASPISLGQKIIGHTAVNNSDDYYKIVIPSDGKYTFTYRTRTERAGFQHFVYDSSFNEVKWAYGSSSSSNEWELTKGTYYYRIKDATGVAYAYGYYDMIVTGHKHSYQTSSVTKATPNRNGRLVRKCSDCGETTTSTIYRPTSVKLSATTYTYNGNAKRPNVTVTDAKGKTISRSYYNVSYDRDSKSAGRHTVRVTFKGNYSGTLSRSYTINPQATYITRLSRLSKGFAVNLRRLSSATATGYQVQYSLNRNFKGAQVKVLRGTSMNIKGLQGNKNYYVRVRAYKRSGGRAYYSAWSGVKTVRTRR